MKTGLIVSLSAFITVASIFLAANVFWDRDLHEAAQKTLPPIVADVGNPGKQTAESSSPQPLATLSDSNFDSTDLQAALAETDPAKRKTLLDQWAASIDIGTIATTLERTPLFVNDQFQLAVRGALLSSWSERDLGGMIKWFGGRAAADQLHQEARDELVRSFDQRDPNEMLDWMQKKLGRASRNELYGPFFRQWAESDPAAAGAKLHQLDGASPVNSAFWNDLLGQVVAQWASSDLHGAISWSQSLPDGPAKSQALLQLSYRWAETYPVAASAYAATQDDPALLRNITSIWAAKDSRSALAWASRLPAGEGRTAAVSSAVAVWAQTSPETALTYASKLPGDGLRNQAIAAALSIWADTKPALAAQWTEQLPEGPLRDEAMGKVLESWAGIRPDQASQWIQTLPPTPSRNSAVSIFCEQVNSTNPDMAFQMAATITNEATRNQAMERAAIQWIGKDPVAARNSIIQSTLPSNIKEQVLAKGQHGA